MLTGPSLAPASGQPPKQLVIFLHGLGADGSDLIDLAPYFATRLPDALFLSPDAPEPCDMAPFGKQWFSLQDQSPEAMLAGVETAAKTVNAFIDAKLAELGLTDEQLALVGFSQGTMTALHLALRRPKACAAVLGYSGLLVAPDRLADEITVRPQVLLVHGDEDDVVPHQFMPFAQQALSRLGVPALSLSCPGLGHSIDDEGLKAGIEFVSQALPI